MGVGSDDTAKSARSALSDFSAPGSPPEAAAGQFARRRRGDVYLVAAAWYGHPERLQSVQRSTCGRRIGTASAARRKGRSLRAGGLDWQLIQFNERIIYSLEKHKL